MLKQKWNTLASREQQILLFAAPVVLVMLVWLLVINPSLTTNKQSHELVEKKQSDYIWMQQVASQLKSQSPRPNSTLSGSLRQRSTTVLNRFGITPTRIQSNSADKVSLFFEQVSFNKIMGAVTEVERNGLIISGLQLNKTEAPGTVSGRLTVSN